MVLDFAVVLDHEVPARPDEPADQRGEDDLVRPVHRLAELAQPARHEQPAGEEAEREHHAEALDREAEDVEGGFHAESLSPSAGTLGNRNPLLRQSHQMAATTHRQGRKAFGKDTGLQARMVLTMFLLGVVYVVLVGVLFAVGAGGVTILVVALALMGLQLFTSDKIAMGTMGVKEVSPQEEPELHGIIERLCVQADLPKPRVCVMEHQMPNAFAMGRSQKARRCARRGASCSCSPPRSSKG